MKIGKQKPCLTRGQQGALSAPPRVGLSHARPSATPGPAPAPRSGDSPGRTGVGTLIFPPREQTQVSYTGRRLYHQRRPGSPEGLRRSLGRRPHGEVQTCAPGGRFSPRPATAQPMRGCRSATHGKPPHFRLPASSNGLFRTALPTPFLYDRAFFLLFSVLAYGSP